MAPITFPTTIASVYSYAKGPNSQATFCYKELPDGRIKREETARDGRKAETIMTRKQALTDIKLRVVNLGHVQIPNA